MDTSAWYALVNRHDPDHAAIRWLYEDAAWDLFQKRRDKTYWFTDCTSFVVMRRLGLEAAITLDDDFRREGFSALPQAADGTPE